MCITFIIVIIFYYFSIFGGLFCAFIKIATSGDYES